MAKSALKIQCLNGYAEWNFPFEVDASKIGTLAPLTLGVVKSKIVTTETKYTDTITEPEGDKVTGIRQRKAVCVFKHTPTTGEPRLHRISIPAPAEGDTGIYSVEDKNGTFIPIKYSGTGTAPGKDGTELAVLFKAAATPALDGTFEFLSGVVVSGRDHA
jgi:hypothetical protein